MFGLCQRAHEAGHWMSSVYDLSLVLLSKESPSPLLVPFLTFLQPFSGSNASASGPLHLWLHLAPGARLFLLLEGSVPILYLQRGLLSPSKTF